MNGGIVYGTSYGNQTTSVYISGSGNTVSGTHVTVRGSGNTVTGNTNTLGYNISVTGQGNVVQNNTIDTTSSASEALVLVGSGNTVENNQALFHIALLGNVTGDTVLDNTADYIGLFTDASDTITGNTALNPAVGAYLRVSNVTNSTVTNNTAAALIVLLNDAGAVVAGNRAGFGVSLAGDANVTAVGNTAGSFVALANVNNTGVSQVTHNSSSSQAVFVDGNANDTLTANTTSSGWKLGSTGQTCAQACGARTCNMAPVFSAAQSGTLGAVLYAAGVANCTGVVNYGYPAPGVCTDPGCCGGSCVGVCDFHFISSSTCNTQSNGAYSPICWCQ